MSRIANKFIDTTGSTAGQILTSNGPSISPSFQNISGSSAFVGYASSQVTTLSTGISSTSFATFSNSPAFTFTPTITGIYKVYCAAAVEIDTDNNIGVIKIFNTSGGATLLQESQAWVETPGSGSDVGATVYTQSNYTLTAGTTYQFDIQGKVSSGSIFLEGNNCPFYMFAEGIGLITSSPTGSYAAGYFSNSSTWSVASSGYNDPTNSGGNTLTTNSNNTISITAAASNLPGIVFTPANINAVYIIQALVSLQGSSSGDAALQYRMTDGTIVISSPGYLALGPVLSDSLACMSVGGIYVPGTSSPVTVKIQIGANSGSALISPSGVGNSIEWTVIRIA